MVYIVFISLAIGIFTYKIARKLLWEERFLRKRKERRIKWNQKQKGVQHGEGVRRGNKPPRRKR